MGWAVVLSGDRQQAPCDVAVAVNDPQDGDDVLALIELIDHDVRVRRSRSARAALAMSGAGR